MQDSGLRAIDLELCWERVSPSGTVEPGTHGFVPMRSEIFQMCGARLKTRLNVHVKRKIDFRDLRLEGRNGIGRS